MKLSIFGRHPIPQGGFNGIMSLFEAIEFSRLGYETNLLIPFVSKNEYTNFLEANKIHDLNTLDKFNGHFDIKAVFPDGENFPHSDVLIYQSYNQQDWDIFHNLCRDRCVIFTKNFPKFVSSAYDIDDPSIIGQFKIFDLVGCSLKEDVTILQSNKDFFNDYRESFCYTPRGASPELLHLGYKNALPPTIGFDIPNTPADDALSHYIEPIKRLRRDYPELQLKSLGRSFGDINTQIVPFGRFDRIYENFFNHIHVYCTINYEFSPPHLKARVQSLSKSWRIKAIYEVQNIEAQMSGASIIGHRDNLISELYRPGITGFNFSNWNDEEAIYRILKHAIDNRYFNGIAARNFAENRFKWKDCISLWNTGIQTVYQNKNKSKSLCHPIKTSEIETKKINSSQSSEYIDIDNFIKMAQKYKWPNIETRRILEDNGINLVRTDFYSESPILKEIEDSFEYIDATGPNDSRAIFDDENIFIRDKLKQFAIDLLPFAKLFNAPVEFIDNGFFWKNDQFSSLDAVSYYSFIRKLKPKIIVEIGSGFSTHVAHTAVKDNGFGKIICVDPSPRCDIESLSEIVFFKQPIQKIDWNKIHDQLNDGDILFYDGSHTIKTGSDAVYFYLIILPYLKAGITVHVHDVRLPYPRNILALKEAKLYWGEQYLLMAHLHNKSRYQLLFGSEFLRRNIPDISKRMMMKKYPVGGVSLWFKILNSEKEKI